MDRSRAIFFGEPLFDLQRKWALFEDGEMRAILTTTGLTFGWGRATGIAGVATDPRHQRRGLAARLLEAVLDDAECNGEGAAMLFAHRTELYARLGFAVTDDVVKGFIVSDAAARPAAPLPIEEVRRRYDRWSIADPARLVRDEARWRYWAWMVRACEPVGAGYVCLEGTQCREAVGIHTDRWRVPPATLWTGLASLTRELDVPLVECEAHLYVMARGFPAPPRMFMTDQF